MLQYVFRRQRLYAAIRGEMGVLCQSHRLQSLRPPESTTYIRLGAIAYLRGLARLRKLNKAAILSIQPLFQIAPHLIQRYPLLLHRIALADCHGLVLFRLPIDGHRVGRADFVHSRIPLAD